MAKKISTKKKGKPTKAKIKKVVKKIPPKNDVKNTSKNTLKIEPKIEETIIEKEDNNTLNNDIASVEEVKSATENDVLQMLRIPTQNSLENEREKMPEKEAPPEFDADVIRGEDEPFFEDGEKEDPFTTKEQRDNLNEDYMQAEGDGFDDFEGEDDEYMFDDHVLMADMGVEIIDLLIVTGCQAIAKDFGNEEKYSVSQARKNRLKRPLAMLLKKRDKKLPPEVMFVITIIGVYAPVMITAVQERQRKAKAEQNKKMQEQEQPQVKKKGRPKGSKDSKPRKPKTINIKANERTGTAKPKQQE